MDFVGWKEAEGNSCGGDVGDGASGGRRTKSSAADSAVALATSSAPAQDSLAWQPEGA